MGIRFKSNTWRAPLRLIDNLLPAASTGTGQGPRDRKPFRLIDAFVRAGWLKGSGRGTTPAANDAPGMVQAPKPCSVRVVRAGGASPGTRHDMKLVISGRIGDVCAELDRLAALEQASYLRRV